MTADTIKIDTSAPFSIQTTNNVIFQPYTANTSIAVAGTGSTLNITSGASSILANTTAGSITIGNSSDSGAMTVNADSSGLHLGVLCQRKQQEHPGLRRLCAVGQRRNSPLPARLTLSAGVASTGSGAAILFNNAVTLGASDTVSSTNGNITFSSTVDGTSSGVQSLTVNSGTGTTTFTGKVGNGTPLGNLTVTADSLTLGNNVFGAGTLTIAPSTASTNLHINDGTSSGLYLTSAEQGYIQNDWASVAPGATPDHRHHDTRAPAPGCSMTLNSGSGAITFAGNQTLGSNENFSATTTSGNINTSNSGIITTAGTGTITMNSGGDINLSNFGLTTANSAVSLTATGNAYLNAINSGTGSLTVNATNVYLYGGGLASPTSEVAYYNFNEGSGTTAIDDSGTGNTGTIHGSDLFQQRTGRTL